MRARTSSLRSLCAVLVTLAVVDIARRAGGWELGGLDGAIDRWLTTGIELGCCVAVVLRVIVRPAERLAWAAFAGYVVLTSGAELGWTIQYDGPGEAPVPNWTDGPYLGAYLFAAAGLALLLRDHVGGQVRLSLWLDGVIAGLSITAVCAAVVFAPGGTSSEVDGWGQVVTTAYPVLDLVLLGLIGAAYGVRGWRVGRTWLTLGVALAVVAIGDSAFWWASRHGGYDETSWIDGTWPLSMALVAWAAWAPADAGVRRSRADYGLIEVPLVFAAISLAVLVRAPFSGEGPMAIAAAAAALVTTGTRTWITHHENVRLLLATRREADEDGLTGLPNRRRLMGDLDLALTPGTGPSTLVFLDLDGFKPYNDTHGHLAGDGVLVELGCALRDAVADGGAAYRLGGDEFCMLLPGALTARDPRIARAVQALYGAGGDDVGVGSSCGLVVLPREAATPTAALRLADLRMYEDKRLRRALLPGGRRRPTDPAGGTPERAADRGGLSPRRG